MDRNPFPGMLPHARTYAALAGVEQLYERRGSLPADVEEAGSVEGAGVLADDIADRLAIATPAEIDGIVRNMWVDHTHGLLTENEMEALDEAARTRREAFQERRPETRPKQPFPAHHGSPHEDSGRPTSRPRLNGAAASSHPAHYRRTWPPASHGARSP
jgi:hypothetical protein